MVLLTDPETGIVDAMIDGTELTRMRTGAVSGLATELLANEDASVGALFGTGGQSFSQLEAMLTVRQLEEVRIFDANPARAEAFVRQNSVFSEKFGAKLIAAKSSSQTVIAADIITTVTTSVDPVFEGHLAEPGTHINAVGTFMPNKRELDAYIMNRADKIYIDNKEAVMSEAGEFLIPIAAGDFSESSITGELGELLIGSIPGRTGNNEITLMKTVGFATLDIVIAHKVYERAMTAGIGTIL